MKMQNAKIFISKLFTPDASQVFQQKHLKTNFTKKFFAGPYKGFGYIPLLQSEDREEELLIEEFETVPRLVPDVF